jgi:hypothetical protein
MGKSSEAKGFHSPGKDQEQNGGEAKDAQLALDLAS